MRTNPPGWDAPTQVLEFRYPVVLEEFSVRRGSGGGGRHRGGAGVLRRIRFNEAMEVRERAKQRRADPTENLSPSGAGPNPIPTRRSFHSDSKLISERL